MPLLLVLLLVLLVVGGGVSFAFHGLLWVAIVLLVLALLCGSGWGIGHRGGRW